MTLLIFFIVFTIIFYVMTSITGLFCESYQLGTFLIMLIINVALSLFATGEIAEWVDKKMENKK